MDVVIELLKLLGPAVIVLYAMYLMVRSFMQSKLDEIKAETIKVNRKVVTPVRLQAYERITLLLERVSPSNIVSRLNHNEFTVKEFQAMLVNEIRQEFNHNLSQQVYMSDKAWSYVTGAIEDTKSRIKQREKSLPTDSKGIELAHKIFERVYQKETDVIQNALTYLKDEIRQIF
jgi:hypothetical protein